MKSLIIILAVLLSLYANIYAENPYSQFGCNGKELLTEQEKSGERKFVVVSNDSLSEFEKIVFDLTSNQYFIFDKDNVLVKCGKFDLLIPKRWLGVDPLKDKHSDLTPYHSFNNNPILFIDPDGMDFFKNEAGDVKWADNDTKEFNEGEKDKKVS
jgi:hypothetical protein